MHVDRSLGRMAHSAPAHTPPPHPHAPFSEPTVKPARHTPRLAVKWHESAHTSSKTDSLGTDSKKIPVTRVGSKKDPLRPTCHAS